MFRWDSNAEQHKANVQQRRKMGGGSLAKGKLEVCLTYSFYRSVHSHCCQAGRNPSPGMHGESLQQEKSQVKSKAAYTTIRIELDNLWKEYRCSIGFMDRVSMGNNWLAQVQASENEDETTILIQRAQHLHDIAQTIGDRLQVVMPSLLEEMFEFLDEADELEHLQAQAKYVKGEAVTLLKEGAHWYIRAVRLGYLWWQDGTQGCVQDSN